MTHSHSDFEVYGVCRVHGCGYVWTREFEHGERCPGCDSPTPPMYPSEAEARVTDKRRQRKRDELIDKISEPERPMLIKNRHGSIAIDGHKLRAGDITFVSDDGHVEVFSDSNPHVDDKPVGRVIDMDEDGTATVQLFPEDEQRK